jgi:hypothetical protein
MAAILRDPRLIQKINKIWSLEKFTFTLVGTSVSWLANCAAGLCTSDRDGFQGTEIRTKLFQNF